MSTRTRTTTAPAKKTATRKTTRAPRKKAMPPVSLVKPLPTRTRPWMTDTQGFATLAALIAGIPTHRIRDWRDHRNGTATRKLRDGSTLHYNQATRTLTWQAICPMGAIHAYQIADRSTATAARVHADRCNTPHHDLTTVPALTADELATLGILHAPTAAVRLPGDPEVTQTLPVPRPAPTLIPRALADTLVHSNRSNADTQPLSHDQIAAGLAARAADQETPKEHPQP
jgi:hypothetical protein